MSPFQKFLEADMKGGKTCNRIPKSEVRQRQILLFKRLPICRARCSSLSQLRDPFLVEPAAQL